MRFALGLFLAITALVVMTSSSGPDVAAFALLGTPGPTPEVKANNDWAPVLRPNAPSGVITGASCVTEAECWVAASNARDRYSTTSLFYHTPDGGATWTSVPGGGGAGLVMLDQTRGFTNTGRTTDGGKTWTTFYIDGNTATQVQFVGQQVAYGCAGSRWYRTDDAGRTWNPYGTACGVRASYLTDLIAWGAVSPYSSRSVWYTADGWKNRADILVAADGEFVTGVAFTDYLHGWATAVAAVRRQDGTLRLDEALLYRTVDGGANWVRSTVGTGYTDVRSPRFTSSTNGWVVAVGKAGMQVLRTTDGGASWLPELTSAIVQGPYVWPTGGSVSDLFVINDRLAWVGAGSDLYGTPQQVLYKHYPDVVHSLTPTPTVTPTSTPPPTTPTPTRTPFVPVIPGDPRTPPADVTPGPTQPAITCSWGGDWDTVASAQPFRLSLNQASTIVRGTYGGDRTLEGAAGGNKLVGRWAGPPTFAEPNNAGRFEFTVAADCQSFTGSWGFDQSSTNGGSWSGTRTPTGDRQALVRAAYLGILGREPDPGGLAYWSGTTLPIPTLENALRASEEGQRVGAVRGLYRELLLRDPLGPDNGGLHSWVDSPLTLPEIRAAIAGSPEGSRVLAIRALYAELLGRPDDAQGIRFWYGTPLSIDQIRQEFLRSDEYRRTHPGAG